MSSQTLNAIDPLEALAAALRGDTSAGRPAVWDDIVDVAQAHGVDAVLAHAHASSSWLWTPADVSRLKGLLAAHAVLSAVQDRELMRVLDHLAAGGVSPVVIKGAHLAHTIYASPALRPRADTDLVIGEEEQDATASALAAAGYCRKVHVRGVLILGQCHFERTDGAGIAHALDVHWRLAAPLVFRRVLPASALRLSRVPIPALGPHAWGPGAADALTIACVHLAAHHRDHMRLMWLHDIARLAEALDDSGTATFVETAAAARIGAVCAWALDRARRYFDGPALAALASRAHAQNPGSAEPSARLLVAARPIQELWLDVRAAEGWRERTTLLREHLWPDAEYMRATTARTGWLPLAYARRGLRGARGWVSPTGGDR